MPGMFPPNYQPQPEPQSWTVQSYNGPAKNPAVVEERRQARKAEIERRCLQMSPPLDPKLLPSMDAFQAAMQIALPLTDQAWEALKPRLLAQREKAELDAYKRAERAAIIAANTPFNMADNNFLKPAKEIYDKSYDVAQGPLRARLTEYLSEYVNASWNGHPHLDYDSCPVFAAKAIIHVYQRYKEDEAAGTLPKAAVTPKMPGQDDAPFDEPFLSLDNMKWLFEQKIKPYINDIRRDIFICAGCQEDNPEGALKLLAFEGLIQHYGAKHTTAFSKGNITVYWQTAEWPEEPPFYPQPEKLIRSAQRKTFGWKGRPNAKGTPQPRRDGVFNPPATENGHVSHRQTSHGNGYYNGTQAHPHDSYSQNNNHQGQLPAHSAVDVASDRDKANQLAADFREVWNALAGVPDGEMLNCIRLQTAVHHATSRFVDKYRAFPTLDLVTDALASNPIMQPIKTAGGLACKTCVSSQTDGSASKQSYYGRITSAKLYNTSSLVNHFQITHLPKNPRAMWHRDMWELPETQMVQELAQAEGMDNDKFNLIVQAFPQAFNYQSHVDIKEYLSAASNTLGVPNSAAAKAGNKRKAEPVQSKKKRKRGNASAPDGRAGSQELPYPDPKDNEYDPRHPMASTEEEDDEAIAAKFDTDIARKKEAARAAPPAAANAISLDNLAPETLRALQALGNGVVQPAPQAPPPVEQTRYDRAPSVGRDDYYTPPQPAPATTAAPPASSNGVAQPDIAAILASLQGGTLPTQQPTQPQVATPTGTAGRGSSRDASVSRSTHREQGVDPLHRSLSYSAQATSHQQDRPSTSGYSAYAAPPPQQSFYEPQQTPAPAFGSDLQAALERNSRHFSINQAQQPPSTPQGYGAVPAYAQHQASPPQQVQHAAPPRYGYGVEMEKQGQGYAQGYGYAQPPPPGPPTYAQGYAPPPAQQAYGQQQQQYFSAPAAPPAPRTVYVDEHGREIQLIPVEAAQQYAPPPAGQQYAGGGYYVPPPAQGQGQGYYGAGGGR